MAIFSLGNQIHVRKTFIFVFNNNHKIIYYEKVNLFICLLTCNRSIVACKQESKFQIINGIVYDATMNNITLITGKGDTVNISTMDANRDKVCGVLLEDSVEVVCIKEKMEGKEILKAAELTIIKK